MKHIKIIIVIAICSSLSFMGCGKDEIETPEACFTINNSQNEPVTVSVGAAVIFAGCSIAEFYTVWPGDLKHDYNKRPEVLIDVNQEKAVAADAGFAADLKTMSYSYKYTVAGTYTVTWVVSNDGNDGQDVKSSIATMSIIVE